MKASGPLVITHLTWCYASVVRLPDTYAIRLSLYHFHILGEAKRLYTLP